MKDKKAITLVSLIITIVLLIIVSGATIGISLDGFKTNNLKKMYNDIELMNSKIENYYIKFGNLPTLGKYNSNLTFNKDVNDNENYYIIDLSSLENITLNYGKEGFENPNNTDDVYIINEKSHTIYYVRGIELSEGKIYHSLKLNKVQNVNVVGPTKPEINILTGTLAENQNDENIKAYIGKVEIEIIPGKDSTNGIYETNYTITSTDIQGTEYNENNTISESTVVELEDLRTYSITAHTINNSENSSTNELTFSIREEITSQKSYVGYYADIDKDGTVDGVIFADLLTGSVRETQKWGSNNVAYTLPTDVTVDNVNSYYISKDSYTWAGILNPVISPKTTNGNKRFYIMQLSDFTTPAYTDETDPSKSYPAYSLYFWYKSAYSDTSEYATTTSNKFGTGKTNTATMIEKWNNGSYGTGYNQDIWKHIQEKADDGWFIPSTEEWVAFANELGITSTNWKSTYGLSTVYWTSKRNYYQTSTVIRSEKTDSYTVNSLRSVRLANTF